MPEALCDVCSHKVACRREGRKIVYFACDSFEDVDEVTDHE